MAENSHPDRQDGPVLIERNNEVKNVIANGGQDAPRGTASADIASEAAAETPSEGKHASTGDGQDRKDTQMGTENDKPSKVKVIWRKLGLDLPTIVMMFK